MKIFSKTKRKYGEKYNDHFFEQYKIYIEMADRISARRMLANTFFLTLNSALITVLSVTSREYFGKTIFPFIMAVILCCVWKKIISSYSQLNSGKFKVIHEIEKHLPLALFEAEWRSLGEGVDKNKYIPLTRVEHWVPNCFILLYISIYFINNLDLISFIKKVIVCVVI